MIQSNAQFSLPPNEIFILRHTCTCFCLSKLGETLANCVKPDGEHSESLRMGQLLMVMVVQHKKIDFQYSIL